MKKTIMAMVMTVFVTISATAQKEASKAHKKEHRLSLNEFSPEEIAELKTKKLTLALDLSLEQQEKIKAMQLEKLKTRKTKMEARKNKTLAEASKKPQKEERLARMNERLDKQIAEKEAMKNLLNTKQYEKWQQIETKKHSKQKRKRGNAKKHKRK